MSTLAPSLPLTIQTLCDALRIHCDGIGEPIIHAGREVYPALVHFTVTDKESSAYRASFAIQLPSLTPAAVIARHGEVIDAFAATAGQDAKDARETAEAEDDQDRDYDRNR